MVPRVARCARLVAATVALTVAAGCTGDLVADDDETGGGDVDLQLILSDVIPTVATATWSSPLGEAAAAAVVFALDGGEAQRAPVDLSAGAPYEALLLGMKPEREYAVWVEATIDGAAVTGDPQPLTTGPVPAELPGLTWVGSAGASSSPFLLTSIFAATPGPVILDADGELVWWWLEGDREATVSRARFSADRRTIRYLTRAVGGPDQELVEVSLDGAVEVRHPLPGGHHDFVELPDGTLAFLAADRREVLGADVEGDQILEIGADGPPAEQVYSVWDDFEYDPDADDVEGAGWSHANALDFDPAGDAYYVSFLGFDSICKVDGDGGGLRWVMGGAASDFGLPGGGTELFVNEHQFEVLDGSILVFDNGDAARNSSRAVEYGYDEGSREVTELWSFTPSPEVFSFSLGDVHRLDGGNTLIDFSAAGQMMEVTAAGDVVWQLNVDLGGALGYVTPLDTLY